MNNRQRIAFALALTLVLTGAVAIPATAQTIDAGRGPVPLTVPTGYDADVPMPLIVSLHGYSSSGQRHDSRWGIGALADRYGFLTISPDGTREAQGDRNPYWNASSACCNFERTDIDDSAYLRRMIDQILASYNVDPSRIYVIGHSNGGFMSYRMAYEHSDVVAAIVSLAGANHLEQREPPPNPVHVLQIHGTDDTTIAYRGGEIQGNRYPGAFASVSRWVQYNGCDGSVASREVRDLDASLPGHEAGVMKINAGCKDGGSAEQIVEWLLAHSKPAHLLD
jgi:polyhydroxybutyrate depolymerase